jgi:hypothetical protein
VKYQIPFQQCGLGFAPARVGGVIFRYHGAFPFAAEEFRHETP